MFRITSTPFWVQCPAYMNLAKCVAVYHHLQQVQPCQPPDSTPLTQHMTLHSCNFLFSRLQGQLAQQLQEEIYQDHFHTSAEGTKASYCTHRTSYLWFCEHIGYPTLQAQSSHFCKYAAFLAHSLKATSIPNFLNIISIQHKEFNLPNPLLDNSPLQSPLTNCLGLSGSKVCPPAQKQPITPSILGHMYLHLNMHSSFDASFRAICLVNILI